MAEDGDEDPVGVAGVDDDLRDLLGVAQAEVLPGLAAVGGPVDAVAGGEVGALEALAAAHVDHLRIRRRHGDGADRAGGLVVEDRRPDPAVVVALPHPAVVHADVEDVGRAGHAHRGHGAAARGGGRSCASASRRRAHRAAAGRRRTRRRGAGKRPGAWSGSPGQSGPATLTVARALQSPRDRVFLRPP